MPTPNLCDFTYSYTVDKLLGSGAYGQVYAVRDAAGNEFAAKIFKPDADAKALAREYKTLEYLTQQAGKQCPATYIVCYHKHFLANYEGRQRLIVLMELVKGMSFEEVGDLIAQNKEAFTAEEIKTLALNLFQAVQYIHENGIVHRDIKPANVMLDKAQSRLVLIDFGLSCFLKLDALLCDNMKVSGSPLFYSPELAKAALEPKPFNRDVLKPADVWAAGMTLMVMLHGNRSPLGGVVDVRQLLKMLGSPDWQDYIPPIEVADPKLRRVFEPIASAFKPMESRPTAGEIVEALRKA